MRTTRQTRITNILLFAISISVLYLWSASHRKIEQGGEPIEYSRKDKLELPRTTLSFVPEHRSPEIIRPKLNTLSSLKNFNSDEVAMHYDKYLSRIGPGRLAYPFSESGLDTEQNGQLAEETILDFDYLTADRRKLRGILIALSHLKHSGLVSNSARRIRIGQTLAQKIEQSSSEALRSLRAADLSLLLKGIPSDEEEDFLKIGRNSLDPLIRTVVSNGIYEKMLLRGLGESEARSTVIELGLTAPTEFSELERIKS